MVGFVVFLNFSLSPVAFGEYRVFELKISNPDTKKTRTVVTTMDPFQYVDYFPVLARESIYYTNTWMCYGDTSKYTKPCEAPSREPSNVKAPTENSN